MAKLKDRKKNKKMAVETIKMHRTHEGDQPDIRETSLVVEENHEGKTLRNKKRKKHQTDVVAIASETNYHKDGFAEQNVNVDEMQESKKMQLKQKKSKKQKKSLSGESRKANKKNQNLTKVDNGVQKRVDEGDEVYQISSGDEDCSKGMKKWIMEYQWKRPGLKVLQERIDDFITAHEAKEEQERREREALAAEDGWTVVSHHKGRKKTTDTESGVVVGSVTQAAVDKMARKKSKDVVGVDFYRFQRREARQNEIMMLQNQFEQDKKRIQQLRAARKFRPY